MRCSSWLLIAIAAHALSAAYAALDDRDWDFPEDEDEDDGAADADAAAAEAAKPEVDVNEQMWQAAFGDDLAEMEAALAGGADPNQIDAPSGYTILQTAIYRGQVGQWVGPSDAQYRSTGTETARALIEAGAKVNTLKSKPLGGTALMYAAEWKKLEVIELLLAHGADPNVRSNPAKVEPKPKKKKKKSALEKAAPGPKASFGGATALHAAAWIGHIPTVEALLGAGADKSISTDGGLTPFDMAEKKNHPQAVLDLVQPPESEDPEAEKADL